MEVNTYLDFERNYEVKTMPELGSENRYYFPAGSEKGGHDGIALKVSCAGKEWIGVFAFGARFNAMSAIFSMPNPDELCVVSRGAGYIVSSGNPQKWEALDEIRITDVKTVGAHKIIVFADYDKLVAYDSRGLKWRTARLAHDAIEIAGFNDDTITVKYWNPRIDGDDFIEINLNDGLQISGMRHIG